MTKEKYEGFMYQTKISFGNIIVGFYIILGLVYFGCEIFVSRGFIQPNSFTYNIPLIVGFMVFMLPVILFFYDWVHFINKKEEWYEKAWGILQIIIGIIFVIGFSIFFMGTSFEDKYDVNTIAVAEIKDNKIIVDYTKYNNGDTKYIEINKPFYAKVKEGDTINVRYPIGNKESMIYVLDGNIGLHIIVIAIIVFTVLSVLQLIIKIIKKVRLKKK